MSDRMWRQLVTVVVIVILSIAAAITTVHGGDVTYDGRSLIIDGQRKILFSGSIHYPRSTPEMWPSLITKAKEGGIDVIDTYVFWNMHEPQPGQYDFSGGNDIVGFVKQVHAQGLYVCLRIGPFIESEWAYGGLPFWLHDIPGIVFRSDNEPFKVHMQNFTAKIVTMFQAENLYASQGGPIVLSQIENEYGLVQRAYGKQGKAYVRWAADMAVGLHTGVPWVMCKQLDAPDPVINSCNGLKCGETFDGPNSPNKPSLWTENWTTHFEVFGEDDEPRTVEDIAYSVALFIAAKNGSFVNYYMYHGGTNFGRSASAFVKTSYYDQAPIDEYGLINQPKWGHLRELHATVKLCAATLLSGVKETVPLGQQQLAYVFTGQSGGECTAFLVNKDQANGVNVAFRNASYDLPPRSVSILPNCKNVALNTAKVSTQSNTRTMTKDKMFNGAEMWQEFEEPVPNFDDTSIRSDTILEQMGTTKDASDYLWYLFRLQRDSPDTNARLGVYSLGHVLHAFVNGKALGSAHGTYKSQRFDFDSSISLNAGINNVSLLSAMVGLPDSGAYLEKKDAGLRRVTIQDNQNNQDFTNYTWGYQVGLLGEKLQIYADQGSAKVPWTNFSSPGNSLTWYKTVFDAPLTDAPATLDLRTMGKGQAWVNGQSIGRYWPSYHSPDRSSQNWYHVPRSLLKPTDNSLVLFEEEGGNPLGVSLDTVSVTQVCSLVSSSDLAPVTSWIKHYTKAAKFGKRRPKVQLNCPSKRTISHIIFASYGTPEGDCGNTFTTGTCHSHYSKAMVEKACLGKRRCSIPVSSKYFGGDPCPNSRKSLMVVAECK